MQPSGPDRGVVEQPFPFLAVHRLVDRRPFGCAHIHPAVFPHRAGDLALASMRGPVFLQERGEQGRQDDPPTPGLRLDVDIDQAPPQLGIDLARRGASRPAPRQMYSSEVQQLQRSTTLAASSLLPSDLVRCLTQPPCP